MPHEIGHFSLCNMSLALEEMDKWFSPKARDCTSDMWCMQLCWMQRKEIDNYVVIIDV